MRKPKLITLDALKARLQARMNYKFPDVAFNTLLYGWTKHRKAHTACLSSFKKRGGMSPSMARSFADYCGYPIDKDEES